jgi:hypothetical protein
MRPICKYIMLMSFPMLYIASVLMLVAPRVVTADSHLLKGEPLYQRVIVCREFRPPEWAAGPVGLRSSSAGDDFFQPRRVRQPRPVAQRWVGLHVPVALLQALQTTESGGAVVELQVPAALLTLLQTMDLEELP